MFSKNPLDSILYCAENECCCPRTVSISKCYLCLKISIPPEPVSKHMGQQVCSPDGSNCERIRQEYEGRGFESPSGRDIFCLKSFNTFTRTSVHVCVQNAIFAPKYFFRYVLSHRDPERYMSLIFRDLHHVHIGQVSPQLSCGNHCQIWTWYSIGNQCFDNVEKSGN